MGGTTDKVTGRAKQAIGGATGDRGLQREGRRDEFAGDVTLYLRLRKEG